MQATGFYGDLRRQLSVHGVAMTWQQKTQEYCVFDRADRKGTERRSNDLHVAYEYGRQIIDARNVRRAEALARGHYTTSCTELCWLERQTLGGTR